MFSCEYCEIFKNTYFEEYLRTAAFLLNFVTLFPVILWLINNVKKHEKTYKVYFRNRIFGYPEFLYIYFKNYFFYTDHLFYSFIFINHNSSCLR